MERSEIPATKRIRLAPGLWLTGVMVVVVGMRLLLVWQGGPFFFPDEARYLVSRAAAGLIFDGQWRQGLALPFEGGDHAGFKFLGLAPALLERWLGESDLRAGLFWSLFSAGSVLLIGLLAGRLGGSRAAQVWSLVAAATSSTLFYYSRHLLPYDAAMFFALASLWVATGSGALWRSAVAGLLAGGAFAIYYGYWPLTGVVLVWGCLHRSMSWGRCLARGALAGLGALAVVGCAGAINQAWGNGRLFERARAFSGTINQGDYQGSLTTWEFLLRAEGVWAVAAVVLGAVIIRRWRRLGSAERAELAPGRWALVAAAAIWLLFIVTGDVLHTFTVYGRLIRQLTPFLALALGCGAATWLVARPWRWLAGLAGLLVVNAAWLMGQAYWLCFPADFRRLWIPFLHENQRATAEAGAYYRLVNATRYFHEADVLPRNPVETVVAERHPLSFDPYLYELFAAAERKRRRAADQRLRVVRMPVEPSWAVDGEAYGIITLKVRFGNGRPGFLQPLLSVGPFHGGELFFVEYLTERRVRLGCEIFGRAAFFSEEVEVDPGRIYEVACFSGSMMPPDDDLGPEAARARQAGVSDQLGLWLDGRMLIGRLTPMNRGRPAQAYAGANVVGATSTGPDFAGEILGVTRGGFPAAIQPEVESPVFGPVQLTLGPPIPQDGNPEPLVVVGEPGRAVLAYLVPLRDGRVRFGVEVWGVGSCTSPPVRLRGDETDEVVIEFGSLFPGEGAAEWGEVPAEVQAERKRTVQVRLNGQRILHQAMPSPELGPTVVAAGRNPVGGSYVGEAYSGRIVSLRRLPPSGEAASGR